MKRRNSRVSALTGLIAAAVVATAGVVALPLAERALAQEQQPAVAEVKQVELNEKQIQGFLASQRGLIAITDKLEKAGDTIDDKLQAEIDDIARKGGFKDFFEFENVRANVMMVLAGIDPESGKYTDPIELVKQDIATIKSNTEMTAEDKKQQLEELNEALKEMQPLQYKGNIELVRKHFKAIDEVLK